MEKKVLKTEKTSFKVSEIPLTRKELKNLLNYQTKVSFSQGMDAFTEWVLKQPVLENDFEASLQEMKQKGFLKT